MRWKYLCIVLRLLNLWRWDGQCVRYTDVHFLLLVHLHHMELGRWAYNSPLYHIELCISNIEHCNWRTFCITPSLHIPAWLLFVIALKIAVRVLDGAYVLHLHNRQIRSHVIRACFKLIDMYSSCIYRIFSSGK